MEKKEKERSHYFQAIARSFFARRGAPFFLSSQDLVLIDTWKKMEIPLPVVLEGIEKCFQNYQKKPSKKAKVRSLSFCNLHVLKVFEQYRERKVGHKKKMETRGEKRKKIRAEVQKFLEHLPPVIGYLKEIYTEVQKMLSRREVDERALEDLEEEIEELLLRNCLDVEKEKVKKEILAEYRFQGEEEFERVFKTCLVKLLRDRHKIPYISFYYY
jgi:DNA repair ATPase RecN